MGVMREDDGLVGVVGESVEREGVMRGHVEREVVGRLFPHPHPSRHTPAHTWT